MPAPLCQACRKFLKRYEVRGQAFWYCGECRGTLFPLKTLSKFAQGERVLKLLAAPPKRLTPSDKLCPHCIRRMLFVPSGWRSLEADLCVGCKIVWFGQGEFHLSPGNTVSFIALRPTVERPARPLNEPDDFELTVGKPHFDETLALLADLPMEEKAEIIGRDVWVVYLMVALCVGVSLHPKLSLLGLSSSDPWRYWGLTWLTAVFAHAGWAHLFSNVYFLWLFGDNVETRLGNSRFAELFFLSALVGQATTLIFLKTENVIILGASGGIMGLAVFYALSFPSSRLKLMYPVVTRTGVIVFRLFLPTYVLLAGYLAFEYLLVGKEVSSGIAHTAHLGGAVTGFFYWAFSDRALSASSR